MILSGEKKEEYRDITPYYETRFKNLWGDRYMGKRKIMFRNGYSIHSPSFVVECELKVEMVVLNGEPKKEKITTFSESVGY